MSPEHQPEPGGATPEDAQTDATEESAEREAQAEDPTSPTRGFDEVEHPDPSQEES